MYWFLFLSWKAHLQQKLSFMDIISETDMNFKNMKPNEKTLCDL